MIRINTGIFEVNEDDPRETPSRTGGVMLIFWALSPAILLIIFGIITIFWILRNILIHFIIY